MGANERPSVVLSRLNSLQPATLEELYMAIFLHILSDSYREHFAQCKLKTGEELAAVAVCGTVGHNTPDEESNRMLTPPSPPAAHGNCISKVRKAAEVHSF
jgi:hypothetical protein